MVERATRLVLALSAAAAVALQTYLGARAWPHLLTLNVALFVVAFAAARWHARTALWLVLLPAYLFPAVVLLLMHGFDDALWSVWTSLLVGYLLGRAPGARWALPIRWRWPLSLWGLSVAVSWPIIVWREIDFTLAQLDRYSTGVTHIGIAPATEILWIANVAATHLIGILWIDSLYRDDEASPGQAVPLAVAPLLVSATLSAAVAVYQMFGHITALNDTIFAGFRRASGAMVDGNAFGMIAALWLGGAIAVAASAGRRGRASARRLRPSCWPSASGVRARRARSLPRSSRSSGPRSARGARPRFARAGSAGRRSSSASPPSRHSWSSAVDRRVPWGRSRECTIAGSRRRRPAGRGSSGRCGGETGTGRARRR